MFVSCGHRFFIQRQNKCFKYDTWHQQMNKQTNKWIDEQTNKSAIVGEKQWIRPTIFYATQG